MKTLQKSHIIKITKRALLYALFLFIFCVIVFFSTRNFILNKIIQKAQAKIETKYKAKLTFSNSHFTHLFTIHIDSLKASTSNIDFYANNMNVRPSVFNLIFGDIRINKLEIDSIQIRALNTPKNKLDSIVKVDLDTSSFLQKNAIKLYHVFDKMMEYGKLIPPNLTIKTMDVILQNDSVLYKLQLDTLSIDNNNIFCHVKDNKTNEFELKGKAIFSSHKMNLEGLLNTIQPLKITYKNTYALFNYPSLKMEIKKENGKFYFDHISSDSTFQVFDVRLAADTVGFSNLDMYYKGWFDTMNFFMDSFSYFKNEKLQLNVGGAIQYSPIKINWKSKIEKMQAEDLFSSLPSGLFYKINTVKSKGELSYNMQFVYDENDKDNLIFDSDLTAYQMQIDKKSVEWISKVLGTFQYVARTGKGIENTMLIDPNSSAYIPFEFLPKDMINAVLINEDPSFFYHKGFVMEAFKSSLIDNIKSGYFKRGGSTISMQLVKNLYLNRGKTISRKVEEIMIVWLIENQRLLSKEKMMELYFNVIEFGPGVYGLTQAAQFYFSKNPTQLTKNECIFLANIIPRPKAFKYAFNDDGTFRPWMQDKANLVNKLMVMRNMSPPTDTSNYNPNIKLNGNAAKMVITDTVDIDSVLTNDDLLN